MTLLRIEQSIYCLSNRDIFSISLFSYALSTKFYNSLHAYGLTAIAVSKEAVEPKILADHAAASQFSGLKVRFGTFVKLTR